MNTENKRLVKVIAEQYARIAELEEQLSGAERALKIFAEGGNLPTAKR